MKMSGLKMDNPSSQSKNTEFVFENLYNHEFVIEDSRTHL